MNIIEACRLLDKFGGYIKFPSFCGYLDASLNYYWEVAEHTDDGEHEPISFKPETDDIKRQDWLYYNDKFECLTCEECYKLLNDMEGLAPVCECNNSIRITNAPAPVIQTEDAFKWDNTEAYANAVAAGDEKAMNAIEMAQKKEERTIKSAPKQGNIPREDIREAIAKVIRQSSASFDNDAEQSKYSSDGRITKPMIEGDDDAFLRAEEAEKEWHKKVDNIIEDHKSFMEGVKVGEKIKPQYPGMIEVNYLYRKSITVHYSQLYLYSVRIIIPIHYLWEEDFQNFAVSEEEYHRILNLFKASGLEVSE